MLLQLINEIGGSLFVALFILFAVSLLWYRSTCASASVKEVEKVDEKPPKPWDSVSIAIFYIFGMLVEVIALVFYFRFNFPHCFTLQELSEFDGDKNLHSGNPVYISVCGTVYDVTSHPSGRDLYGAEGTYHIFAGHEATLALSTMSIDAEHLDKLPSRWQNFSLTERQIISDWLDKFDSKYDKVGYMKYDSADENAIVKKWNSSNSQ
ncbi:cytochrome b5 family heme/steroid binding domain-containing protein [Cardiosporidium cionae]|uniref:Cytochrome b5 family heme/steroid binding domain-containing protein n=1 Tax=Cardiosporidium cionae TaxID=476202 RepID=A0ABQ7J9L1_9APIC|nr:cytochrome b5 family heme/steroid binding domain-containing protein [Cardiosporidium cionae]|eukprot:KAF8820701.1 cytochrome b5 family heme/steroid binding domain-containing protein [Cardiosporidium cionae]